MHCAPSQTNSFNYNILDSYKYLQIIEINQYLIRLTNVHIISPKWWQRFKKQGGIKDHNSLSRDSSQHQDFPLHLNTPTSPDPGPERGPDSRRDCGLKDNFSSLLPQLPSLRRSEAKPRSLFQEKQESRTRIRNGRGRTSSCAKPAH